MAKSRIELDQERARLTERITAQRATLARDLAPLQRVGQAGNRLNSLTEQVLAYIRQNPLPLAAFLGTLVLVKPGRALRWARRGWMVWRGWRMVQSWQPGLWLGLLRRFL